ncbi:MAG TPA: alpha/beta fold hydrolase, partial [Polymorphobacter sp.]|nr:alpha/beta fold hydrolase [Polymorphobacter sp.]
MSSAPTEAGVAARVTATVERAIQRNIKGLEYFGSAAPVVGASERDLIHSRGTMLLYHYRPLADEIFRIPVLLVMATSSRGYILDLAPGQSFVEFLLKRGYDVYMLDWAPPTAAEKHLDLNTYVNDFLPDCIARVQADSGETDVTLAAYCMGGVLSTMYMALNPDGPVVNFVTFTTPINWQKMGLFSTFSDKRWFDVDRLVESLGNVPPEVIVASFDMLR